MKFKLKVDHSAVDTLKKHLEKLEAEYRSLATTHKECEVRMRDIERRVKAMTDDFHGVLHFELVGDSVDKALNDTVTITVTPHPKVDGLTASGEAK